MGLLPLGSSAHRKGVFSYLPLLALGLICAIRGPTRPWMNLTFGRSVRRCKPNPYFWSSLIPSTLLDYAAIHLFHLKQTEIASFANMGYEFPGYHVRNNFCKILRLLINHQVGCYLDIPDRDFHVHKPLLSQVSSFHIAECPPEWVEPRRILDSLDPPTREKRSEAYILATLAFICTVLRVRTLFILICFCSIPS